jgi:nitrile hydratase
MHDVGGMQGLGAIDIHDEGPLFPEPWESRCFGLLIAAIAADLLNMDEARWGVELMDPVLYVRSAMGEESYYWRWLCATEIILEHKGVFTREEREARIARLASEEEDCACPA